MAWLDQTTLEQYLGERQIMELTDDSTPPTTVDTDVLSALVNTATGIVRGYLQGRYPTQCDAQTASATVTGWCVTVWHDLALRRRRRSPGAIVETGYDRAIRQLEDVRRGEMAVPEWTEDDQIESAKIELQRREDIVAGWEDEELFAADAEHDGDAR